jgi:hypothetical protein
MLERIIESNRRVTAREIHAFGARHGLRLPRAYQAFLLRHNGGQPVPTTFPIARPRPGCGDNVDLFYGIDATDKLYDLDRVLEDGKGLFPRKLLPIAYTPFNDEICIDLRKKGAPVVLWDRCAIWEDHAWKESQLYFIASNFGTFLNSFFQFEG